MEILAYLITGMALYPQGGTVEHIIQAQIPQILNSQRHLTLNVWGRGLQSIGLSLYCLRIQRVIVGQEVRGIRI